MKVQMANWCLAVCPQGFLTCSFENWGDKLFYRVTSNNSIQENQVQPRTVSYMKLKTKILCINLLSVKFADCTSQLSTIMKRKKFWALDGVEPTRFRVRSRFPWAGHKVDICKGHRSTAQSGSAFLNWFGLRENSIISGPRSIYSILFNEI